MKNCRYCGKILTPENQIVSLVHPYHLACALRELDEMEASFDLRWKADMRGIERWRKEKPKERDLTWPDHADMVVWLMVELDQLESLNADLRKEINAILDNRK